MTAAAQCPWMKTVGWREYECELSGVTVDEDCATSDADDGPCIPRIALHRRRGMPTTTISGRMMQMAVEQTDAKIAERVEIGALPLATASDRELEEFAVKARAELISRKRWRRRLPILKARHDRVLDKIRRLTEDAQALAVSIQAIKDGKGPIAETVGAVPLRGMSAATRAKIGAARRRTLARKKREAKEQ